MLNARRITGRGDAVPLNHQGSISRLIAVTPLLYAFVSPLRIS